MKHLYKILLAILLIGSINILQAQITVSYGYDELHRLKICTYSNGIIVNYNYDALGNRTTVVVSGNTSCIAPANLSVSNIGSTGATLNWNYTSGQTYTVEYKASSSSSWITASTSVSAGNYNVTGLNANTTYNWRVKANCNTTYVDGVNFTTLANCVTAANLSVSNIGSTGAILNWNYASGQTYTVEYKASSSSTWITASTSVNTGNYTVTGLSANTTYNWRVKANCNTTYVDGANFTTLANCVAVTDLNATNITTNAVTLNWTYTAGYSYTLEWKAATSTTWILASSSVNLGTFTGSGLTPNTSYDFRVKSNCSTNFTDTIRITTLNNCSYPTANFSYTTNGLTVVLNNTSSNATSYSWNFGNGQTSTLQNPSISYTTAGTYNICLTATNSCGSTSYCKNIAVNNLNCELSIIKSDPKCNNTDGSIKAVLLNGITPITYNWSNGSTLNSINNLSAGEYTIMAIDSAGCAATSTINLNYQNNNWVSYTTSDGLANIEVLCVNIDKNNIKWLGTYGGGVSVFNGTTFVNYNSSTGNFFDEVYDIAIDKQNVKWLATTGFIAKYNDTIWNYLDWTQTGINNPRVISIDSLGNIWVGTYRNGLFKYNGTTWQKFTTSEGLADNTVHAITIDAQNIIWIATENGLSKYNAGLFTNYNMTNGLPSNQIYDIAIELNTIWLATKNGVSKFDGANFKNYNTINGLTNNFVKSIAVDIQGYKWIGTTNGLSKFKDNVWINYFTSNGLVNNFVEAIKIDNQNTKWFGTYGGISKLIEQSTNGSTAYFTNQTNNLNVSFLNASLNASSYNWNFGNNQTSTLQNPSVTYTTAGTYNVCLNAIGQCGSNVFCKQITVSCPLPFANFTNIANNSTVNFTNVSTNATSYNWNFGNGQTSTQVNPNINYAAGGNYTVCLRATNACGFDDTCKNINTVITAITQNQLDNLISIFPNPNNGTFSVKMDKAIAKNAQLAIYDVEGKVVHQQQLTNQQTDITTQNLASGVYIINIQLSENEMVKHKLVIVK